MRLGVYADMAFQRSGGQVSTRHAFVGFLTSLRTHVDEVVLFGRLDPHEQPSAYPVRGPGVRFVALPHYARVTSVGPMLAALPGTWARFARELKHLDAVLVFGPHPVALVLAWVARLHRTPLVLGVRQDYPEYIRRRLPGPAWAWAPPAAEALDFAFRLLARRVPTVALGDELARRYRRGAPVLTTGLSLVRERDVVSAATALGRDWGGELRLLSVGRLDREKDPLALLDVLARLRARDQRWRLTVAGDGPLLATFAAAVARRRLPAELVGAVPNGPSLWRLYRHSHAFVQMSRTEGLPQVLVEAHAAGLPVVATAVGGVGPALGFGTRGLVVPPGDSAGAADALARIAADSTLRRRLVIAGLEHARRESLERQLDRVAAFVRAASDPSADAPAAPASAASSHRYRSKPRLRKSPAAK